MEQYDVCVRGENGTKTTSASEVKMEQNYVRQSENGTKRRASEVKMEQNDVCVRVKMEQNDVCVRGENGTVQRVRQR